MSQSNHLKSMLGTCKSATESLIKDISEKESLVKIDGYNNHVRWELGHMTGGMATIYRLLSGENDFPDQWRELFGRGAILNEDSSAYPSLDKLGAKYFELNSKIMKFLDSAEDSKLMEIVEIAPEWKMNRVDAVQFFCMHDFYHGGQIATLRQVLGKERTFG